MMSMIKRTRTIKGPGLTKMDISQQEVNSDKSTRVKSMENSRPLHRGEMIPVNEEKSLMTITILQSNPKLRLIRLQDS
jgi:hypothetical protein